MSQWNSIKTATYAPGVPYNHPNYMKDSEYTYNAIVEYLENDQAPEPDCCKIRFLDTVKRVYKDQVSQNPSISTITVQIGTIVYKSTRDIKNAHAVVARLNTENTNRQTFGGPFSSLYEYKDKWNPSYLQYKVVEGQDMISNEYFYLSVTFSHIC